MVVEGMRCCEIACRNFDLSQGIARSSGGLWLLKIACVPELQLATGNWQLAIANGAVATAADRFSHVKRCSTFNLRGLVVSTLCYRGNGIAKEYSMDVSRMSVAGKRRSI